MIRGALPVDSTVSPQERSIIDAKPLEFASLIQTRQNLLEVRV